MINEFNLNYYLFKDPDYTAIKYTNLTASDFFQKYLPPSICALNNDNCFQIYRQYYLKTLFQLNQESQLEFSIKYLKNKNLSDVESNNWIKGMPINLGFSIIISYIFFLWTTRFARNKSK